MWQRSDQLTLLRRCITDSLIVNDAVAFVAVVAAVVVVVVVIVAVAVAVAVVVVVAAAVTVAVAVAGCVLSIMGDSFFNLYRVFRVLNNCAFVMEFV